MERQDARKARSGNLFDANLPADEPLSRVGGTCGGPAAGGKLALDTPPGEFLAEMRTLGRIAHAHELPLLAAQIEHVTH